MGLQVLCLALTVFIGQSPPSIEGAVAKKGAVVLGKLGIVLNHALLKESAKDKAPTLVKLHQYQYLVIRKEEPKGWYQILLENGNVGYVPKKTVNRLEYDVTSDADLPIENDISRIALSHGGVPYRKYGKDFEKGIGSGEFVQAIFSKQGQKLPANPEKQSKIGKPVRKLEQLKPGDRLYFWDSASGQIGHAGIYVGNGYFVHSSPKAKKVVVDFLGEKAIMKTLVAARR